jgi:hypothetical protein
VLAEELEPPLTVQALQLIQEATPEQTQGGLYFAEFSDSIVLREVILGARCELPLTEARRLVSSFAHPVSVIKARVAFDSFRIVPDERVESPKAVD